MSKMATITGSLLAALFSATSLMAAPLAGFTLAAETKSFSFYTRGGQKVDAARNETYLAEVQQALGHELQGRTEYYRYASPEEVEAGTGRYAAGLTIPGAHQIHSTHDFHAHEIVHLVALELGNPGPFFHEGLAVALGNKGRWNGKSVRSLAKEALRRHSLQALVAQFERFDTNISYPVAGAFLASLIEKHGVAKVAAFFRNCTTPESRESAFATAFGEPLAGAAENWARTL